jgi:hypothetical protein
LQRLLELGKLATVTLRVIPYSAGALPAGNNKFIILRFVEPAVPDVVYIEGLTRDEYLTDSHEVEVYNTTFRTLIHLAANPHETHEIITAKVANYDDNSG